jgi:uncharacterized damage-inducible protein DinB
MLDTLLKLVNYKSWANDLTFTHLAKLPDSELYKTRQTNFVDIVSTLNHVYVVDDIFKAHLTDSKHEYTSRNTGTCPNLDELWKKQTTMDQWYINYIKRLETNGAARETLEKVIHFTFIGGGDGNMRVSDIILHIVNHGTYHRGFVSDMMYQIPAIPPANDFTVYMRDIHADV